MIDSIREIIYHGSAEVKQYLQSLSQTYFMLFLLKCDPKIVEFFQTIASNLTVFVCTSILVPAFSEIYLETHDQRYWSLLKAAKSRGVKMVVSDVIVSELDYHIRKSIRLYDSEYKDFIDTYGEDAGPYVDNMLIRAFLYAKREQKVSSYEQFVDNFVSVNGRNPKQELIDFLDDEFGIDYVSSDDSKVKVDSGDLETLVSELSRHKKSIEKARADASLILMIYEIRRKNEEAKSSLYGYRTWWLSSDTMTHRTVCNLFGKKFPVSCYLRPDFLYNFISYTPPKDVVETVYRDIFPNLLGIQISNHVSPEISSSIRETIKEHQGKLNGRIKAQIRDAIDELKSNPEINFKERLESFFKDGSSG